LRLPTALEGRSGQQIAISSARRRESKWLVRKRIPCECGCGGMGDSSLLYRAICKRNARICFQKLWKYQKGERVEVRADVHPNAPNFLCTRPTAASAVLCLADAGIAELPDRLGREMRVLLAALWLIAVSPVGEGFLEVIEKNKCFHTIVFPDLKSVSVPEVLQIFSHLRGKLLQTPS